MTENETIKINDLTLCHKHSQPGMVRSTLPDVCRSPDKPVPYTNVAYARDLGNGTKTVFSHGGAMNGIKGSRFYPSYGDEPGTGGGVKSGVNMHEATWLSWSPNVFMEGKPVTRLTDKMHMNRRNTVSVGGYYTKDPKSLYSKNLLDKLCDYICQCINQGAANQKCVDDRISDDPENRQKGIFAEQGYQRMKFLGTGWEVYRGEGAPKGVGVPGVVRPDVSDFGWVDAFNPKTIVEIKFAGDHFRGESGGRVSPQRVNYQEIADSLYANFEVIDMNTTGGRSPDCACTDDRKQETAPERVPAVAPQPNQAPSAAPDAPFVPPIVPPVRLPPLPGGGLPGRLLGPLLGGIRR